ncbi:UBP37 hydrolase, partial [Polypterus senegalus]
MSTKRHFTIEKAEKHYEANDAYKHIHKYSYCGNKARREPLTLDIRRNIVSYVLNDWDRFKVWTDDGTGDNYTIQEHYKREMLKPFTYGSAFSRSSLLSHPPPRQLKFSQLKSPYLDVRCLELYRLNQNIKKVNLGPKQHQCRLQVILKDSCSLMIDKAPLVMAQKFKDYLEKLRMGKQTALKQSQGSVSFGGVLGNRAIQNESSQQIQSIERQTPPRRLSLDETLLRKHLTSPNRGSSTPVRTGLSENRTEKRKRLRAPDGELNEDYPKENDSSRSEFFVVFGHIGLLFVF